MTYQPPWSATISPWLLPVPTVATAAAVFIADVFTPPDCVVSGLYIVTILLSGRFCRGGHLLLVALGCIGLTILAQFVAHRLVLENDPAIYIGAFNTCVSVLAIGLSCSLVLRGQSAETALQRAQSDLAHVSRVTTMGELTASIAHEVNQPIAGVVTNASACLRWLAGDRPDLNKAREAATRIVRDGTRAADIINRIRRIFQKGEAERQPVNINQLAQETIDLLSSEATRYLVTIRTDLAAETSPVLADRVQLQQVIVNLLMNGIDAVRDVTGPREIMLKSQQSDAEEVLVSVSDTGVGLPVPQADHLFDAFFTTKPHGTGLGLSISRSIIESHKGRLWATPNEPTGAIFLFTLPVQNGTSTTETP